jgi:hypothetical protein
MHTQASKTLPSHVAKRVASAARTSTTRAKMTKVGGIFVTNVYSGVGVTKDPVKNSLLFYSSV